MSIEEDRQRLLQTKMLEWLNRQVPITEMLDVYLSDRKEPHNHGIFCGLVPSGKVEECLGYIEWDVRHGDGLPGAVQHYRGEETITEYCRFGDNTGFEPLVIDRGFHGIRPDYLELSEEFRLFHRLFHDRKQDRYYKIDDSGTEHLVAIVEPHRVQIRLKEIRQFLAIKEMHLAIQFDCREHSQHSLEELGLKAGGEDKRDGLLCWGLHFGDGDGITSFKSFSRLLGKRLIPPLPKEKSDFWGFAEEQPRQYVDFIIGTDDDGNEMMHTSDPDHLANYFGANPGSPHYLTPVHFRKEVLDKYYQQSGKYSVEDAILRCGYLWSMYMDNHHDDKVCAWLGDLGRDLPYEEQLHWRSYNIAPVGGMSKTFFSRQILCQFTDSDRPEHEFSWLYQKLGSECEKKLNWPILLPLAQEDTHHIQAIRIPSNEEQKDFDDLVLALTKILVDSLNEKELNKLIPADELGDIKGSISRLERALQEIDMPGYEEHIKFLRDIQDLRSAGTAHRKGSNYRKIAEELGVNSMSLPKVFEGILIKANRFLQFLEACVQSRKLSPGNGADGE